MLIKFEDLKIGDEVIIPSNSTLKYLKILSKTKKGSFKCSAFVGDKVRFWGGVSKNTHICNPNVEEHNKVFYLTDDKGYRDIWLIKREYNV